MILVVGATGMVGSEICQRLSGRGEKVRALVRTTSSTEKVALLRGRGVEVCVGDLKDPDSLAGACRGVNAVISTASSTRPGRQETRSSRSMTRDNCTSWKRQNLLVSVGSFLSPFVVRPVSPSRWRRKSSCLACHYGLNFTTIQASWFMEVWLSPALGFDYLNASARIYGPGTSPVSWVSFLDVAEMCVLALRHPAAERRTIEFGGPAPLSPLEVVARFEEIGGKPFKLEHIPEEALRAQFEGATDSMQKSFAALMLGYSSGDAINMTPIPAGVWDQTHEH